VLATAIGMFIIGFGIPINDFSFGNTLIIVGTVSVTGGFILIGIAAAVRELRRIADADGLRPSMRRTEPADPLASAVGLRGGPGLARGTLPLKPNVEGPGREPRPVEPRLMAVHANNGTGEELTTGRPRPNILPLMRAIADGAVMEEAESVPLSPQAPARAAVPGPARGERAADVKPAQQPVTKLTGGATAALRSVALESPRVEDRWVDKPQHAVEKPQHPNLFDTLWPAGMKVDATPADEAVASEPKPQSEAANPSERIEPVVSAEGKRNEAWAATGTATESPAFSVLKAGVIDGMAYTLYTDGTIDAQLSEGTIRFSSIDVLRDHLEKSP
jgi:hypothetical protein